MLPTKRTVFNNWRWRSQTVRIDRRVLFKNQLEVEALAQILK